MLRKPAISSYVSSNKDQSLTPKISKKTHDKPTVPPFNDPTLPAKKDDLNKFQNYFQTQCQKIQYSRSELTINQKTPDQHLYQQLDDLQKQSQDYKLQILSLEMQLKNYQQIIDQRSNSDHQDFKKQNQTIFHELKLETQNRQILQQQVQQLTEEKQAIFDENNALKLQNSRITLATSEGSLQQTKNFKLHADLQTLREKYDQLECKYSTERQEKETLLQRLSSPTARNKSQFATTPDKRDKSPIIRLSPKSDRRKLETQLEYAQISKFNIEKALEIKLAEYHQKEEGYLEKIARLEKQIKSKNYFDHDKRPQLQELEKQNTILKNQLDQTRISHSAQILELANQTNTLKNQKIQIESQIKQLQYEKNQQEKRLSDQIEAIKLLKQQISDLKNEKEKYISDLKIAQKESEKTLLEKLKKVENELKSQKEQFEKLQSQSEEQKKNESQRRREFEEANERKKSLAEELERCQEKISLLEVQLQSEKSKLAEEVVKCSRLEFDLKVSLVENENNKKLIDHLSGIRHNSNWEEEMSRLQSQINVIDEGVRGAEGILIPEELRMKLLSVEQEMKATRDDVYVFETDMSEYLQEQLKNLSECVKSLDCEIALEEVQT